MGNLLKDIYSTEFYEGFSQVLGELIPDFIPEKFRQLIFDENWPGKELKQRMRHTSLVLHQFLPEEFQQAAKTIEKIIEKLRQHHVREPNLEYMFLADYIEVFGMHDFKNSINLIEFVTPFASCEYAVRPFIIKYGDNMLQQMHRWSSHKNHHVRRLASEGTRPRLPWAIALPELKKDPAPILPLLEKLKNDPSEYVRRSVANSLNDISKDHPDIVIAIAQKWKGVSKETDGVIRHGCRTLLKQGNPEMLNYYGLNDHTAIELSKVKIHTPEVKTGHDLLFSFTLHHKGPTDKTIRLEYAIYYLLQNGKHSRKVFKISERVYQANESVTMQRKQKFKIITTRKFYPGPHKVSLIINGKEQDIFNFELLRE
ncbi:DNA alkylation repair protein [Gaoshiqia sp. Z1-71]|uniref:DNA alkylation repair protein n=1 Tax=Gaoshiqia hydrogeniformans TaxID=3290090 RepID=UPI003BF9262E